MVVGTEGLRARAVVDEIRMATETRFYRHYVTNQTLLGWKCSIPIFPTTVATRHTNL